MFCFASGKMRGGRGASARPLGLPSEPAGGTLLSHYRIEEQIGARGMGVVFRAVDTRLDRVIAIKTIAAEAVDNPLRRERFLRRAPPAR